MPKIDITELDRELRAGKIRPIYTIVGAERYLATGALSRIQETLTAKGTSDLSNLTLSGREVRGEEILNSLKTVPLLGGRPVVVIREAEGLSKSVLELLADYAARPVEASTLVIVAEKLDGRSRFMQIAQKSGVVVECKPLYMDKVPLWINMEVKKRERQISQNAANFLAEMVGNNLGELSQAIERVILYIGDRKIIEIRDVEDSIAETHQHDIFEFTDAVGARKLPKVMALLQNILGGGQSPVLVLNMLARHFRILSKAKEIAGRAADNAEIAKYLGVHPFFAKNYVAQSRNFSKAELKSTFMHLHRCDRALKSSRIDKQRIIEKAVLEVLRNR